MPPLIGGEVYSQTPEYVCYKNRDAEGKGLQFERQSPYNRSYTVYYNVRAGGAQLSLLVSGLER